jgi:hypothetical protein
MKTDVIMIHGDLKGHSQAMQAEEKFAAYHEIYGKNALHLRLLTEEAISMIHGILDDFRADFWLESERTKKGLLCRICISVEKQVNREQEAHILSVATSGKNENARGIVGKIREIFRRSLQTASNEDEAFLQSMNNVWSGINIGHAGFSAHDVNFWSLQLYRQEIESKKEVKTTEWDELEKSIIAKLADEVKVWLNNDSTEVTIEKLIR